MIVIASSPTGLTGLDYVSEPTPPIIWSFANQGAFQVKITPASDRSQVLHNSTKIQGAAHSYTVPAGVITTPGARYSAIVTTWDNRTDRYFGDQSVTTTRDFTFALDSTTEPLDSFTVTQPDGSPRVRMTANRGTAPDSFSLEVDGVIAVADIDPADVLVSPGSYQYDYWGATAFTQHNYRLLPVVNGRAASRGTATPLTTKIAGAWLCDPATGARFNLLSESLSLAYAEEAEVTPKAGQDFTRKITSMRGIEGEVSGVLVAQTTFDPRALEQQLDDVYRIKGRQPSKVFRFATADMNIPVVVGNVSPAPSTDYVEHIPQRAVSYWIGQRGELPYAVTL